MRKAFLTIAAAMSIFTLNAQDLKVKTTHLDNGMKVVLCEDHSQPRILGAVYVHVGSKNDPLDATGMAHYFEHIMFKGTDRIGTLDWEAEKVYLDSIDMMYDRLYETTDAKERDVIQHKINELTIASTEYAIPNETDVILTRMGGDNLNAFTSYDQTCYFNDFPSNQLEKWCDVYVERFRNPVFRLFQSELETVYEEKNMYGDSPINAFQEQMFKEAFGEHPYGRPVIGFTEHLKNPQPAKMREFYKTYYVANNMTLGLIGDFNIEEIEPMIAEKFGQLPKGEVPPMPEYNLPKFEGKTIKTVKMTPIKMGTIIFPSVKNSDPDVNALEMAFSILSNGETGLLDKYTLNSDLMAAAGFPLTLEDHGANIILYVPKLLGQSHEEAESIIFGCIDDLKKGNFSDDLFEAIKINTIKDRIEALESQTRIAYLFLELEQTGKTFDEYQQETERLKKITKEEIVEVANKYFTENCECLRSKMGFPKKDKIDKPDWKPIEAKNTEAKSEFAQKIDEEQVPEVQPQVIEFGKDVKITDINDNFKLYSNINTRNDLFQFKIVFNYGSLSDPDLERALTYFEAQGTETKTFEEYSLELQKLGANIYYNVWDNEFTITLEGFEKDQDAVLALCYEKLYNTANDESKKKFVIENEKANIKMQKEDASTWMSAVQEYALYGGKSKYLNKSTIKEWEKKSGEELLAEVREALKYDGYVTYCGNQFPKVAVAQLKNSGLLKDNALKGIDVVRHPRQFSEDMVFVAGSKKFRQSNITMRVSSEVLSKEDKTMSEVFNKYFGTDMYSIVFQEIREFRSLGYSAYGYLAYDYLNRTPSYLHCFLGTQSDKTLDGIEALRGLIANMPERMEKFNASKEALILQRASDYVGFRAKAECVKNWMKMGYDHDPRIEKTEIIRKANYNNVRDFYERNVKDRPIIIMMSGNSKKIDLKKLAKWGKVTELKYEDIFKE